MLTMTWINKGKMIFFSFGNSNISSVSMAKWWTSEKLIENVTKCQQLFGGYGFMEEYPISHIFTGARVESIYGGTTEIMKEIISKSL